MTFVNERTIKAVRKSRRCDGCSTMINVGDEAIGWAGAVDGDFSTATFHTDCRNAEIGLNRAHGTGWSDDWMGLGDMEDDDHPWLLAKHPIVAARMSITAETIAQNEREAASLREASRAAMLSARQETRHGD